MLGLGSLIGQLWEDVRGLIRAEINLVKSRAFAIVRRSRSAIILLLISACMALASLAALMLGLVLALVPLVGAAFAGLILMAGGLAVAGLLAWMAVRLLAGSSGKADAETTDTPA